VTMSPTTRTVIAAARFARCGDAGADPRAGRHR